MTIDRPAPAQIPALRALWKQAFGDTDDFLDIFFHRAFSPDRCRCLCKEGQLAAALYWFDCSWKGKRLAYLYAVATDTGFQGQGLCRQLMLATHEHLRQAGYAGAILSPQNQGLFTMYGKFGYRLCGHVSEFSCHAGTAPVALEAADPQTYAAARRKLLPADSVVQEGITLDFLSTYARLYTGSDLALAAYPHQGKLVVCELLGSPENAPGILAALGYSQGTFRVPGQQMPYAMYLNLDEDTAMPAYFGLALD